MNSWMINLAGKVFGADSVVSKIVASKTYVVGIGMVLVGAGGLCAELANVADLAGLVALVKGLASDANFISISAGLGMIGLRHSNSKIEAKIDESGAK